MPRVLAQILKENDYYRKTERIMFWRSVFLFLSLKVCLRGGFLNFLYKYFMHNSFRPRLLIIYLGMYMVLKLIQTSLHYF